MSDDEDRIDDAIEHALGSLTPERRATYEAHLSESPEARRESIELLRVAQALEVDRPAETPPAGLRQRLLAQVAVTAQETSVAPQLQPTAFVPAPAHARAEARWFRRPAAVAAAAAAAVVLFGGGTLLGVTIGDTGTVTAQQATTVAQISAAADSRRSAASVAGGGTATLVWSLSIGKAVIVVDGVGAAPSGKTYQLWYIRGGQAISAGLMAPHANGSWQILDGTMRSGDGIGMTVEPKGGSTQPTTKPVLAITS
ncbi:MAG: anti-sigma factor [Leifsonia sp.]